MKLLTKLGLVVVAFIAIAVGTMLQPITIASAQDDDADQPVEVTPRPRDENAEAPLDFCEGVETGELVPNEVWPRLIQVFRELEDMDVVSFAEEVLPQDGSTLGNMIAYTLSLQFGNEWYDDPDEWEGRAIVFSVPHSDLDDDGDVDVDDKIATIDALAALGIDHIDYVGFYVELNEENGPYWSSWNQMWALFDRVSTGDYDSDLDEFDTFLGAEGDPEETGMMLALVKSEYDIDDMEFFLEEWIENAETWRGDCD